MMTEQEEFEFRARMEAEQAAQAPAKQSIKPLSELPTLGQRVRQNIGNVAAGAVRGAGSIGSTLLYPIDKATDMIMGDRGPNVRGLISGQQPESRNDERRRKMDEALAGMGAETDSWGYKGGKIGTEIAGTLGVGGAVANGARFAAPSLANTATGAKLLNAVASGGFKTGVPAATTLTGKAADLGVRSLGGAVNGGLSAGVIDPQNAKTGAVIGAALPPSLKLLGAGGKYVGGAIKSVVQPLTRKGQQAIAANVIREFGEGGPMAINANEIVPGSVPTLAEATGNAGLATLQRASRDLRPNAFVEREMGNAAARTAAFDDLAGDAAKLEFFRAERAQAGKQLYDEALNRAPEATTPYMKGQITQLLKRPSINEASRVAQRWAIERGERASMSGSLRALHDVKTAIDDKIAASVQAGQGGEVKALEATRDKLLNVMEKMSPEYGQARATYAAMSKPVNEMEALQALRLVDQRGNITLAKVQNALAGLERLRAAPGVNAAKSVGEGKIRSLQAIRDDLLRQDKTNLGRSAGSNTFQNLATDNILGKLLPGKIGSIVNPRIGEAVGQVGKLAYSGANEKIRNNLVDMMLDPTYAQRALSLGPSPMNPQLAAILERMGHVGYRAAPQLAPSR